MDTVETNGVHTEEDAEMAECDGEKVVTMMDVLQEQQEFEEDANAVLGASDEKECTYSKGYIKRQAIYACLTCCSEARNDPNSRAGVCLACSLNCHENHELIELYTRRNFRCDCGNPKFNSHPCQFTSEKPELNEENLYNQNFSGLYCTCQRPYPDPENPVEDEMIQCIICEDWLHSSHLETTVPPHEQYSEMICKSCMEKNEFLHDYSSLAVMPSEAEEVDVTNNSNVQDALLTNGVEINHDPIIEKATEENKESSSQKLVNEPDVTMATEPEDNEPKSKNEENNLVDEGSKTEEISEKDNESDQKEKDQPENKQTDNNLSDIQETEIVEEKPKSTDEEGSAEQTTDGNASDDKNTVETSETVGNSNENPTESKEVVDPSDDNKEIEAIDKLLGEDTTHIAEANEEKVNNTENDRNEVNISDIKENTDKPIDKKEETEQSESQLNEPTPIDENSEKDATESKLSGEEEKNIDFEMKGNGTFDTISNGSLENKRKLSTDETPEDTVNKKARLDESSSCIRPKGQKIIFKGATFWPSNFRQKLCTCNECTTMYKDLSLLYIIDLEDTVSAYEALGKEKINGAPTQYEKGLQALSSLDRIHQINALTEYNNMRDKLLDFLKSFKDRKEVVKEEDIKAFFAGMKPKRESDGVYFCR